MNQLSKRDKIIITLILGAIFLLALANSAGGYEIRLTPEEKRSIEYLRNN